MNSRKRLAQVRPIPCYIPPEYPTRDTLRLHPEMLRKTPHRWQNSVLLAALLAATSGTVWADDTVQQFRVPRVAPLFKHGDGNIEFDYSRAAVSTSPMPVPPQYAVALNEHDACQIINEQLERAGLPISTEQLIACNLKLDVARPYPAYSAPRGTSAETVPVVFDGFNQEHGISYEYISQDDRALIGVGGIVGIENFRNSLLQATPDGVDAVFYDPSTQLSSGFYSAIVNVPGLVATKRFTDKTLMPLNALLGLMQNQEPCTAATQTIILLNDTSTVILNNGSNVAEINGDTVTLPEPVTVIEGVVYAPVRAVVEGLGFAVNWQADSGIVAFTGTVTWHGRKLEWCHSSQVLVPAGDTEALDGYAFLSYAPEAMRAFALVESKRLLRLQVSDFIAWLKAEGIQ